MQFISHIRSIFFTNINSPSHLAYSDPFLNSLTQKVMEMPRISLVFSTIWLRKIAEFFISITSAIIFFFLDFLDFVMCIFFRFLDEFLEGKPSSCYCKVEQEKRAGILEIDEESELSETFLGRKNVFREMGFLRIPRMRKDDGKFCAEKRNSWSDCGCESCVSWMNNGGNLKLHVVVKEPERGIKFCQNFCQFLPTQ